MKRKLLTLIVSAVLLSMILPAIPVAAADPSILPENFYGTVKINGTTPAPVGTTIEARGTGVIVPNLDNPITITQAGTYGTGNGSDFSVPRLIVRGDIAEGTLIKFYVNNILAEQTALFASGNVTLLNLSTPAGSLGGGGGGSGGGGGGGGGGGTAITVTGLQSSTPLLVNASGQVQSDVVLTDTASKFNLNIRKLTSMTVNGSPASLITATPVNTATLPPLPKTAMVLAYDFGPNGMTFTPEITLTMNYEPAKLPNGVKPQDLAIAYLDVATAKYIQLQSTVDTVTNSITALVQHFTTYVIMGAVTDDAAPAPTTPVHVPTAPAPVPTPTAPVPSAPAPIPTPTAPAPTPTAPVPTKPAPSSADPAEPAIPEPASYTWIWYAAAGMGLLLVVSFIFMRNRKKD